MLRAFLLYLLVLAILIAMVASAVAYAQADEPEPVRARILCDGARVAAIQILATGPGLITLELPRNICGRSA